MHGLIIMLILATLAVVANAVLTIVEKVIAYRSEVLYWRKARRLHRAMLDRYFRRKRFGNRFA